MANKTVMQRLNLDLPVDLIEEMKKRSLTYSGCKRKRRGSAALFARQAIFRSMKYGFDVDFEKKDPEYYKLL